MTQPTDDARNAGPHEIDRKALNDMQQKATGPVDDTNHRRNTAPVDSYAPAPEPVESIKQYALPKGFTVHINGFPVELQHEALIKSGTTLPLSKSNDSEQSMLARLLVQAKLEEAKHCKNLNYGLMREHIKDPQSQLEGAADE